MALRGLFMAGCCLLAAMPVGLLAHGTFHERLRHMQEEIEARPGDPLLQCRMAELHSEHGNLPEALAAVERAAEIDPEYVLLDLVRGAIFLQTRRLPEARAALDRYLTKSPGNSHALLLRARTKVAAVEPGEALADYREALRVATNPQPDLYQEVSDALLAQGSSDEALTVLETGLRVLGPIPSLTLRAMDLEVGTGRFDAALSRVDFLQKSAPRPEPWMAKRAALLAQAGRTAEARQNWNALLVHLAALPNLERGSHSMSMLAEQARRALAALDLPSATPPITNPAGSVSANQGAQTDLLRDAPDTRAL